MWVQMSVLRLIQNVKHNCRFVESIIVNSGYLAIDRLVGFIYYKVYVSTHVDRETFEK